MAKRQPGRFATPRIAQSATGPSIWIWGLFLIVLAVWSWQVYNYGRDHAGNEFIARADTADELRQQIAELERERDELRLLSARHQRASQIDREATRAVQAEIRSLRRERADLQRKAASLRDQLSGGQSAFEIVDYSLQKLAAENHYGYSFTVSRMVKGDQKFEGRVLIRVAGELQGEITELPVADANDDGTAVHKLGFKHFQKIEGDFELPPDFIPHALIIDVETDGIGHDAFSRSFGWI